MTYVIRRLTLGFGLVVAGLLWNGEIWPTAEQGLVSTAEAVAGRPATPVSYAGVARRSTVGVRPASGSRPASERAASAGQHRGLALPPVRELVKRALPTWAVR